MTLQTDIERGARAERLINDPTLAEAFDNVKQAIFAKIEQTPIRDTDGLTQLRLMLKLLTDVRANLDIALKDGKLAAAQVEQERTGFRLFSFNR